MVAITRDELLNTIAEQEAEIEKLNGQLDRAVIAAVKTIKERYRHAGLSDETIASAVRYLTRSINGGE